LVGQIAKRQAVTNAECTVSAVKRLMGRNAPIPSWPSCQIIDL